jgi:hypothetical protein
MPLTSMGEGCAKPGTDRQLHDPSNYLLDRSIVQSVAGYIPQNRVTMRVSSALQAKADKLPTYRERAVIGSNDQAVIAIDVGDIPHGVCDAETYGLRATYSVGSQYVVIDRETGEPVDSGNSGHSNVAGL